MTPSSSPDRSTLHAEGLPSPAKGGKDVFFVDMSKPRQLWESVGGAVLTGAVCGVLLGFSLWAYLIGVAVSFIGGIPAGGQHHTLMGALARGFVGGGLWAAAVVVAVDLMGRTPAIALPEPQVWFLPWGIVPACVIAAVSWFAGRRRRRRVTS